MRKSTYLNILFICVGILFFSCISEDFNTEEESVTKSMNILIPNSGEGGASAIGSCRHNLFTTGNCTTGNVLIKFKDNCSTLITYTADYNKLNNRYVLSNVRTNANYNTGIIIDNISSGYVSNSNYFNVSVYYRIQTQRIELDTTYWIERYDSKSINVRPRCD